MRRVPNSLPPTEDGEPSPLTDYRAHRATLLKSRSQPVPSEESTQGSEVDRRSRLLAARRRSASSSKAVKPRYPSPKRSKQSPSPQLQQPPSRADSQEARPQPAVVAASPSNILSAEQTRAILDENDRLRVIEGEFWNLLNERESLLETIANLQKRCASLEHPSSLPIPHPRQYEGRDPVGHDPMKVRSMEIEIERLQLALHEAMDLLIADEVKQSTGDLPSGVGNVKRDGPVASFVDWLTMVEERRELDGQLRASKTEMGRWGASPERRQGRSLNEALKNTVPVEQHNLVLSGLHDNQVKIRKLQEELDRTDSSRRQALEDVDVLRSQLEQLNADFKEVSHALSAHRSQQGGTKEIAFLKDSLYQRDEEIKHLKMQMRRLVEEADRRSSDLAFDAERIRREVSRRSASREPSVAIHEVHDADL